MRSSSAENFTMNFTLYNALVVCTAQLSCNGNGYCNNDSEIDACECVGFTGRYCDVQAERDNVLWVGVGFALVGLVLFFVLYEVWQRHRSDVVKHELAVDAGDVDNDERARLVRSAGSAGALMTFENVYVEGRVNNASGGERAREVPRERDVI